MTRRRIEIPNLDHLIERYLDGESCLQVSNDAEICESTFRYRLRERGIPIRSRTSYAAHTDAAHAARRGMPDSMEARKARAATRERKMLGTSHHEDALAGLLDERGVGYTRQKAIGPYNLDFALHTAPVAVEVHGGGGNPRVAANRAQRLEYLISAGWHVVDVFVREFPIDARCADYVVAYADEVSRDPTSAGQHWMIRGDGKMRTPRRRH